MCASLTCILLIITTRNRLVNMSLVVTLFFCVTIFIQRNNDLEKVRAWSSGKDKCSSLLASSLLILGPELFALFNFFLSIDKSNPLNFDTLFTYIHR